MLQMETGPKDTGSSKPQVPKAAQVEASKGSASVPAAQIKVAQTTREVCGSRALLDILQADRFPVKFSNKIASLNQQAVTDLQNACFQSFSRLCTFQKQATWGADPPVHCVYLLAPSKDMHKRI